MGRKQRNNLEIRAVIETLLDQDGNIPKRSCELWTFSVSSSQRRMKHDAGSKCLLMASQESSRLAFLNIVYDI